MTKVAVGAAAMLIVKVFVADWEGDPESVTWAMKLNCPVDVGVPVIEPDVDRDNPGGN